ncbi:MAG: type II secretion system protein [bacterium]
MKKKTGRKGFTLTELMLVVIIIGILLTVSIPSMVKSIRGSRLRAAASAIARAGKFARSMAIMDQQEVRLTFHKTGPRIEAHGSTAHTKLDRTLDGVRIDNVDIAGGPQPDADNTWTVSYMRNGRCTPYSITIANSRDETMTIQVDAFTTTKTKAGN